MNDETIEQEVNRAINQPIKVVPQVTVFVNGSPMRVDPGILAGHLKLMAGGGMDRVVFVESPEGPGKDRYITDFESINVKDGDYIVICPDGNPK